ncbi:polyprenyl synthetase family protein, partial [Lactobacillus sp. XV13L]|nr:polyprenyl synthetase family protein [Lactobacillus sp. XV13L]
VKMGALCTQADQEQLMHLQRFAQNFGVAFQIYDDILDVTSTEAKMGKKVGKDQAVGKNTYVSLLGLPSAQERLAAIVHQAHQELQAISLADSILAASLEYFD